MDSQQLLSIALGVVVAIVVAGLILRLIAFLIPLVVATVGLVLGVFMLDKAMGGTAFDQLVAKITSWISRPRGG